MGARRPGPWAQATIVVTTLEPTDATQELWQAAEGLLSHRLPDDHLAVRLLGVGVSGFEESVLRQGMLFD